MSASTTIKKSPKSSNTNSNNTANQLTAGAVWLAHINANIGAAIGTGIFLILTGVGIYYISQSGNIEFSDPNIVQINAVVSGISGPIITLTYTFNGIAYQPQMMNNSGTVYQINQSLNVFINKNQPQTPLLSAINTSDISKRKLGFILLAIGLFCLIVSWGIRYFVFKSNTVATYMGSIEFMNLMRR